MSRVLMLTLVFAPDGVSTSVLMTELAQELQNLGHDITVLTTTPHYNVELEARAHQPLQRRWGSLLFESEKFGIQVYHAAIPEKGNRVGTRLLDYARFHAISTLAGLTVVGQYDLIFAPSPPLTIGLSAWLLCQLKGVPYIYNVQEIYPDVAVSLGMLKNRRVIMLLEAVERFIYSRSRVVTVISEKFRQRLLQKGVLPSKLRMIPNFVDTEFISPGDRPNPFSTSHELDDKFVVLYAGNIGLTQGFETILAAARQLIDITDLRFVIVGDGTRRNWLEAQLAAEPLSNMLLLPYQPRSMVPHIYATADLCLVPLKKGTAQETFPSKIYTIMAAGRPVLAAADPDSELAWVVKEAQCGWAAQPDDVTALGSAIRDAFQNSELREWYGQQGRDYVVAHHSRQAVVGQYDALFREVTGEYG